VPLLPSACAWSCRCCLSSSYELGIVLSTSVRARCPPPPRFVEPVAPTPCSDRMRLRVARRRRRSGDLLVFCSRPSCSRVHVGLAPLSGLPDLAPYHRCRCSPEAPRRRRARSARPRPFQPLRPPPLDARRRAASNAPSHNPADPLCAKPAPLPSRAAAFGSSESTPARLRPVADVAPRGLPCEADVWAHGALLTMLTQSTR